MSNKILVVEDDNYLRMFVTKALDKEGFTCSSASNGESALKELKNGYYDLVIMDLDLGDMNGKDIIGLMRRQNIDLPVIVMSTFSNINIKVDVFDTGCDDYITKPFYIDELIARVKRLLKRNNTMSSRNNSLGDEVFSFGDIEVDFSSSMIRKSGELIDLTSKNFKMLSYFIKNRGQVVSKDQLISRFWPECDGDIFNTLSVHIHSLRSAIEEQPSKPRFLKTKRGMGYIFNG